MKLRISRRKRRIALALYWGGMAGMIFSGFLAIAADSRTGILLMIYAGMGIGLIGALWAQSLYRCPQCGRRLIGREGSLTMKPYHHCPDCGWKTEIEWID